MVRIRSFSRTELKLGDVHRGAPPGPALRVLFVCCDATVRSKQWRTHVQDRVIRLGQFDRTRCRLADPAHPESSLWRVAIQIEPDDPPRDWRRFFDEEVVRALGAGTTGISSLRLVRRRRPSNWLRRSLNGMLRKVGRAAEDMSYIVALCPPSSAGLAAAYRLAEAVVQTANDRLLEQLRRRDELCEAERRLGLAVSRVGRSLSDGSSRQRSVVAESAATSPD